MEEAFKIIYFQTSAIGRDVTYRSDKWNVWSCLKGRLEYLCSFKISIWVRTESEALPAEGTDKQGMVTRSMSQQVGNVDEVLHQLHRSCFHKCMDHAQRSKLQGLRWLSRRQEKGRFRYGTVLLCGHPETEYEASRQSI